MIPKATSWKHGVQDHASVAEARERVTMQHIEADSSLAVERYLLGEMPATEIEEFEEHMFLCPECADAVKAGAAFAESARAVFKDEALRARQELARESPGKQTPWRQRFAFLVWAPAFAALALACIAGYQRLVVISALRNQVGQSTAAQSLPVFALHTVSRGSAQQIEIPANALYFSVYFDVTTDSSMGYRCEIRDASGAVKSTVPAVQRKPDGTISLLLERSQFPAGDYVLALRTEGPDGTEMGQYPFKLIYK
jgi:Putative zinc-finger